MKKEDFINKLKEHLAAIEKKNQEIQQSISDLNILIGHKNECIFWIENFENEDKLINKKEINPINKVPITLEKFKEISGASDVKLMKGT